MDKTLANGPMVAARSGIAVDANHQVLLVRRDFSKWAAGGRHDRNPLREVVV